ncbi:hypothetical protein [Campylobacter helveticus]|uniref:hypothetical protein n=1 Tax=Campylobacter helveticus TaxID=28898 RepID=UPI0022EAC54F|nr:hypothetical protein [Campylobacter helveticus]
MMKEKEGAQMIYNKPLSQTSDKNEIAKIKKAINHLSISLEKIEKIAGIQQ